MKTAVVTGASGDIGRACCLKFLEAGYNVAACYNNNQQGAKLISKLFDDSRIIYIKADISKREEAAKIFEHTINAFGRIDVVVNNAAVALKGLIQDVPEEDYRRLIDVNVTGTYNMCSLAVGHMIKNHSGSIVNISSMWGETGASCETVYSMSKAAVIGLTKALAKEVGPSGIRVNCVSPGLIDTAMNSCYTKEDLQMICDETPLMRIGQTDDVAKAVLFLAGDESSFITGQVLGVNGGYNI